MAEITITIRGLDDLAASLIALANAIQIQAMNESGEPAPVVEPKPEKITKTETNKTKPSIDLATLMAKFVEVAQRGKRAELKALLTEFGSENVSGLAEDVWDDVYARLEAM